MMVEQAMMGMRAQGCTVGSITNQAMAAYSSAVELECWKVEKALEGELKVEKVCKCLWCTVQRPVSIFLGVCVCV